LDRPARPIRFVGREAVVDDAAIERFLMNLAYQAPQILVYLVGFVLGLMYLRRTGAPATLCLVGCGLSLAAVVIGAAAQALILQRRVEEGLSNERVASLLSTVGIAGSVVRALGLGLIVVAVFLGRRSVARPITGR
jgi:hypothetical protein